LPITHRRYHEWTHERIRREADRHRRLREEAQAVRLFEDISSGKNDCLALCWTTHERAVLCALCALDRLGRSLKELLETVVQLQGSRARIPLARRMSRYGFLATGELVFHVFGAIAHFERRLT